MAKAIKLMIAAVVVCGSLTSCDPALWEGIAMGMVNQACSPRYTPSYPTTSAFSVNSFPSGSFSSVTPSSYSNVSSSSVSSSSSSSMRSSSSTVSKCHKCNGSGWVDCCSHTASFGNTTYHNCSTCGKSHQIGAHSCKCPNCDKGIVRN